MEHNLLSDRQNHPAIINHKGLIWIILAALFTASSFDKLKIDDAVPAGIWAGINLRNNSDWHEINQETALEDFRENAHVATGRTGPMEGLLVANTCAGAITVTDGYEVTHSNSGGPSSNGFWTGGNTAFNQGSGANHNIWNAVWFKYVGTGQIVEIGSREMSGNLDVEIVVNSSTGGCAGPWTFVAGSDDPFGGCGASCSKAFVRFLGHAGVSYYIAMDGQGNGSVGNFKAYVDERTTEFNPADVIATIGNPASIQIPGLAGVTMQNIQWEVASSPGGPYTIIPGATTATLNFPSVSNGDIDKYYRAKFNIFVAGGYTSTVYTSNPALLSLFSVDPNILIKGNGNLVANRSTAVSSTDNTDFGTVSVAGGMATHTFTIENPPGRNDLILDGVPRVEVAGRDQGDFTVTVQPGINPVAGGGSTSFNVKFDPSAPGVRSAVIVVTHNDFPDNPFVFRIEGVGN